MKNMGSLPIVCCITYYITPWFLSLICGFCGARRPLNSFDSGHFRCVCANCSMVQTLQNTVISETGVMSKMLHMTFRSDSMILALGIDHIEFILNSLDCQFILFLEASLRLVYQSYVTYSKDHEMCSRHISKSAQIGFPSVRQSVRHQVCPRDNSSPVQARITKFGP